MRHAYITLKKAKRYSVREGGNKRVRRRQRTEGATKNKIKRSNYVKKRHMESERNVQENNVERGGERDSYKRKARERERESRKEIQ